MCLSAGDTISGPKVANGLRWSKNHGSLKSCISRYHRQLGERRQQEVSSSLTHAMRDKPVTTTTALITDVAYWRSRLQTVSELIYISTAIITCKQ